MTQLLTKAFTEARKLPPKMQDEVAQHLLDDVLAKSRAQQDEAEDLPEPLRTLVASGRARAGRRNDPSLYPRLEPVLSRGTAQDLLDEDREDRW